MLRLDGPQQLGWGSARSLRNLGLQTLWDFLRHAPRPKYRFGEVAAFKLYRCIPILRKPQLKNYASEPLMWPSIALTLAIFGI